MIGLDTGEQFKDEKSFLASTLTDEQPDTIKLGEQYAMEAPRDPLNPRNKVVGEGGAGGANVPAKYTLTDKQSRPSEYGTTQYHTFKVRNADGKKVGFLDISETNNGKDLHIGMVKGLGEKPSTKQAGGGYKESNTIGNKEMMGMVRQLKQEFPDAHTVSGFRISGARASGDSPFTTAVVGLKPGARERYIAENPWKFPQEGQTVIPPGSSGIVRARAQGRPLDLEQEPFNFNEPAPTDMRSINTRLDELHQRLRAIEEPAFRPQRPPPTPQLSEKEHIQRYGISGNKDKLGEFGEPTTSPTREVVKGMGEPLKELVKPTALGLAIDQLSPSTTEGTKEK